MEHTIRILHIEDDPGEVFLLKEVLDESGRFDFELVNAQNLAAAKECLSTNQFDMILLDLGLPDGSGMNSLDQVMAMTKTIPVIVLTGLDDFETSVKTLENGAQDYIVKGSFTADLMFRSMRYAIERKKLEIQLKQRNESLKIAKDKAQESERLKSSFLANMSHEIRTPMNGILGFTELLQEPRLSGEEQERYLNIIKSSGKRMLNTLNDLIEIAKIDAGEVKTSIAQFDFIPKINDLYNFFKPEAAFKGLEFKLINRINEVSFLIESDEQKLESILSNLIKNAIKYTHSGAISIECNLISEEQPGFLEMIIVDTGIGIPQKHHTEIFNRFSRTHLTNSAIEGSGLGLAIVKAYVDLLKAQIMVESTPGTGSIFRLRLPL